MVHIKIKKGLDIPIKGAPQGNPEPLIASGSSTLFKPKHIALDLKSFDDIKFKVLVKVGDVVKIGQPLLEDKSSPGRMFCSPAAGTISEVKRGLKRALLAIIIEVADKEDFFDHGKLSPAAPREQIIGKLLAAGLFANIRSRPFNLLADPTKTPRSIFVKAVESAPFVPPAEMQVAGYEDDFQTGLDVLTKLTNGKVNLVYKSASPSKAFNEAKNVEKHTVEGPHPISNASLHIQHIDPITAPSDIVWTLNAHDVVAIGHLFNSGKTFIDRIISIAGPGIIENRAAYIKGRTGLPINGLISGRVENRSPLRFISGDPLLGTKIDVEDFLGYYDYAFTVIPENTEREFLHFFRLGGDKYSFSKAYLSGHYDNSKRLYNFTTNQHGEHRAFIDGTLSDDVMPLPISTMLLVKAVMSEDFELAEQLGLLSVDSEDFALPAFVCPSKVEMVDIIKQGLRHYAVDVLS